MSANTRAAMPARARSRNRMVGRTVGALGAAAVGIVVQIASGAPYPSVPPGLIIVLVAAALVWFAPWRWMPLLGVLAAGFQVFGLFAAGQSERLVTFAPVGDSIGLWIQLLGLCAAVIAGIAAVAGSARSGEPEA